MSLSQPARGQAALLRTDAARHALHTRHSPSTAWQKSSDRFTSLSWQHNLRVGGRSDAPALHSIRLSHAAARQRSALNATAAAPKAADEPKWAANVPSYCSGCGVKLQQQQPDAPGFFQLPKRFSEDHEAQEARDAALEKERLVRRREEDELKAIISASEMSSDQRQLAAKSEEKSTEDFSTPPSRHDDEVDLDAAAERAAAAIAAARSSGAGQSPETALPAGSGHSPSQWEPFDAMIDEWDTEAGASSAKSHPPRQLTPEAKAAIEAEAAAGLPLLCTRCYSLTHYGGVKSAAAESHMPAFDLGRKVGNKIAKTPHRRAVLLCVVDIADFDGSLPRAALAACIPSDAWDAASTTDGPQQYLEGGFRLVVVANKCDLLPSQVSSTRIERWVRQRTKQGGLPRLSSLHLVSSIKGTGVPGLLAALRKTTGRLGDVWVVGAQNAGKSSLINAMRKEAGLSKERNITTASLPGTTLGMLKVEGLMPGRCMMFDTPGVPHPHQLTSMLQPDEVKMLLPRKAIKPRTFRIGAGYSVLLGGTCRFDVVSCPAATLYLTVWASPEVVTHFGKTEAAAERQSTHSGSRLTPPLGNATRIALLPQPTPTDICVAGNTFRESGTDVAIAGLGWVGIAVDGDMDLRVWALPGVAITTRSSLVPDLASDMQRPGFSSDSGASTVRGQSQGRQQQPRRKKSVSNKRRK